MYVAPAEFRSDTLAEYCAGLDLALTEASDAHLVQAIYGMSQRVDDWTGDHFESEPANEVQTLDFGDIAAADTFKLTWGANASATVTYSADMSTDIDAALAGLAGIADDGTDTTVTKVSTSVYTVTFTGLLAATAVGPITITNQTGFTATGVTETTKGVARPTLELDVATARTSRLFLPRRCTAVTSVRLRDEAGVLATAEDSDIYRLHSSLDALGACRVGVYDWIDLVPDGDGLADVPGSPYLWPVGAQSVQVIGTFGWLVTPRDIRRAVAVLVYDHFKPIAADLRRAERWNTADASYSVSTTEPSGIREVDTIMEQFGRVSGVGIG